MYIDNYNKGAFRYWCQKVLPLVYDDSLSYYELLCKVVHYLNNVIQAVNEDTAEIDNLKTLFAELKEYVDNYFNNLDVDETINNKLDKMVEDGTFPASWFVNRIQGNVVSKKENNGLTMLGNLNLTSGYRTQGSQVVKEGNNYYLYVLQHISDHTQLICSKYSFPDLTLITNKIIADPTDSNSPFYWNGNTGGVHGNSMCYDDVNNQLIVTDSVSGYFIYVPLSNFSNSTVKYWKYLGNSQGKISGFCISPTDTDKTNSQYGVVIPTSASEIFLYYINDSFETAKVIGRGNMGSVGNCLKQDCCMSESNFIYLLCCNTTGRITDESDPSYNTMEYDNNFIVMYSPQIGLFKKIYYPKFLGVEMEGISRVKGIEGLVGSGFVLTDLYGGVYLLEMDTRQITSSHTLKTRDLLTGISEPILTFGGAIIITGSDHQVSTTPTAKMNEINCKAKGDYITLTVIDGERTVGAKSWLFIPTEIQTIRMKSDGGSFVQNRNFRNVINPVSLSGYNGIARQTGNQLIINMSTGFCTFDLIYTVQVGNSTYKEGVAVLSGFHFSGWEYDENDPDTMVYKYYEKFYSTSALTPVSYDDVFNYFKQKCMSIILKHLTKNTKALSAVTDYTLSIANMGGIYSYPRYSQSALFTIPLVVEE